MISFEGKVGVVTGSGSGIGKATAIGFAKAGGTVVVADISPEGGAATVNEIVASGGKAASIKTDMTKLEDIQALFDFAVDKYGRVDFLHNNAYGIPADAYTEIGPLGAVSDAGWEYGLNMGLTSYFRATRAVLPIFEKPKKAFRSLSKGRTRSFRSR